MAAWAPASGGEPRITGSGWLDARLSVSAPHAVIDGHETPHVAGPQIGEAGLLVARARGSVLMQVALVDAGRDQRVTLQVDLVGRGHAHVADQHVRQTSNHGFPYTAHDPAGFVVQNGESGAASGGG